MAQPLGENAAEKNLTPAAIPSEELAPLSVIRTETVLSRLPIHNLAKKGTISIQLTRRNAAGEVALSWKVSPSRDFGEPRQLAYKLDTIVVNKCIDEERRPLPKILRVGSLKQICAGLDLTISGKNKSDIKNAFLQNAGALISAKLNYKGLDGSERRLEAVFTRYGIAFTGEKLPDGRKADAVHLLLNGPYWEILNNAPFRPLDYDYLKVLPPAAQRFYEVISYRIFAALKFRRPIAKHLYSDYCAYSAQRRYYDYDHFKKQMWKVHRPHVASGYLKSVHYEPAVDAEGKPDWVMYYTPGPKAKAEHRTFQRGPAVVVAMPPQERAAAPAEKATAPRVKPSVTADVPEESAPSQLTLELLTPLDLVRLFHQLARRVENYEPYPGSREVAQAEALLTEHGPETATFVVEYAVRSAQKTKFEVRTFGAVLQYVNDALEAYDRRQEARAHEARLRAIREEAERRAEEAHQRAEARLKVLPEEEYQALYERVKAELLDEYPSAAQYWQGRGHALEPVIRSAMVKELQRQEAERTRNNAREG